MTKKERKTVLDLYKSKWPDYSESLLRAQRRRVEGEK